MKCEYHQGQLKTHICLQGLCKQVVLCPICIVKDQQNHMTIELLQFQKSVANLISQHDNPQSLNNLIEYTNLIAKFDQSLQECLKLLYQKEKKPQNLINLKKQKVSSKLNIGFKKSWITYAILQRLIKLIDFQLLITKNIRFGINQFKI